MMCDTIIKTR